MTATIRLLATTNEGSIATGTYGTGRRVKATTVQLGPLEHTARKTSDAVDVIEANLAEFLAAANDGARGPIIVARDGYVSVSALVLSNDGPSWHETTVEPSGRTSGMSSSRYERRDRQEARMRLRLAQRVADWQDSRGILELAEWVGGDGARELVDYAGFQRAWIVAGHKDVPQGERHQWADAHRKEYAPVASAGV